MPAYELIAYGRLWRDRHGRFAAATDSAREQLRGVVQALSRAAMEQLIYSKPESVSPTGRPLWTRTRDLLNAEKAELGPAGEVILTNAMSYAEPRHEAGKPGRRSISPDRVAHWRDNQQSRFRQAQLDLYQAAVRTLLGRG